ncbi:MAG: hypothetical protein WC549_01675 [Actinomycetota bacterium]
MKKNKLYFFLAILSTIFLLSFAALCSQCSAPDGEEKENEGIEEETAEDEGSAAEEEIEAIGGEEETGEGNEEEASVEGEEGSITDEKEETVGEVLTAPAISLQIIEGPSYSQLGDNACYYRVKANVTGSPYPAISFNKDDSLGSWGQDISQINLYSNGDSFTLEATATNSQGTASATIILSYSCQNHIPILVKNNTGGTVTVSLSGPGSYTFTIPSGQQTIYVIPGNYSYTGKGCGGSILSGTQDLSESGYEWMWWCEYY